MLPQVPFHPREGDQGWSDPVAQPVENHIREFLCRRAERGSRSTEHGEGRGAQDLGVFVRVHVCVRAGARMWRGVGVDAGQRQCGAVPSTHHVSLVATIPPLSCWMLTVRPQCRLRFRDRHQIPSGPRATLPLHQPCKRVVWSRVGCKSRGGLVQVGD